MSISKQKQFELFLSAFVLRLLNYQRIHIVGSARSGTTMLHYALTAFKNVLLFDRETSPYNHPGLPELPALLGERLRQKGPAYFISKRNARWYEQTYLHRILLMAQKYDVKIINLIRDPRDVLTSYHPLHQGEFYVTPDKWLNSINAGQYLAEHLDDRQFLQMRYEDIVLFPESAFQKLHEFAGLVYREGVSDWASLKSNLSQAKLRGNMIKFMHKLRDFDKATIGSWQNQQDKAEYLEKLLASSVYGPQIMTFFHKYGY